MQKTVTVEDVEYFLQPLTTGDALDIQDAIDFSDGRSEAQKSVERTLRTVAASLRKPIDEVRQIPWLHYLELISPALEINGLKAAETSGETQAGASPAA